MPEPSFPIVITCPSQLEKALLQEMQLLGIDSSDLTSQENSLVTVNGNLSMAYKLVLWSRVANRVLLPIASIAFEQDTESKGSNDQEHRQQLFYQSMKDSPWEQWCEARCKMAINWAQASGQENHPDHGQYMMYRLKDAICDRFRELCNQRPDIDTRNPDIVFHLWLSRNEARVYLDLGGGSLHRRGYREHQQKHHEARAPLKENLAAALLILAGWHEQQYSHLVDPLCGSGTFLIEGAMIQTQLAPGLLVCGRDGALPSPGWLGHQPRLWSELVSEAREKHQSFKSRSDSKGNGKKLFGLDGDKQSLAQVQLGAQKAGVADWIHVERRDLARLTRWPRLKQLQQASGLLITNPPYGERLGDKDNMPWLYKNLGLSLQAAFPDWRLALLAANKKLTNYFGIDRDKLAYHQGVHNGPLLCDFSVSTIPSSSADNKTSPAVLKLDGPRYDQALKLLDNHTSSDEKKSLLNRLYKNAKKLNKWIDKNNIECYRIYDGDIPEFNLAIDVYGQHIHVQEYAPPKTVNSKKADERIASVKDLLQQVFSDAQDIHYKTRSKQKGKQQYKKQDSLKKLFPIAEGTIQLLVNLDDYLDTGLFLDHRPMRLKLAKVCEGKRFLNLFCYTSTATMHAAMGENSNDAQGAKSSVSVDLSPAYIEWSKSNLALNGLSESNHQFIRADVMSWLEKCSQQFDVIFIDPPTFSNSKRTGKVFDIQKDHYALISSAKRCLEPGGVIYFSNNFRRFKLDDRLKDDYLIEEITPQTLDEDCKRPGKPAHRCWEIRAKIDNN